MLSSCHGLQQRVLRREDHVCRAKESVWPCREDAHLIAGAGAADCRGRRRISLRPLCRAHRHLAVPKLQHSCRCNRLCAGCRVLELDKAVALGAASLFVNDNLGVDNLAELLGEFLAQFLPLHSPGEPPDEYLVLLHFGGCLCCGAGTGLALDFEGNLSSLTLADPVALHLLD